MTMVSRTCRICGNSEGNAPYTAREMLHGSREEFEYFQCARCGCLQISTVPDDLARYYPSDYQVYKDYTRKARARSRHFLDSRRVRYELTGRSVIGRLLAAVYRAPDYASWCKKMGIKQDAKILDVGCGNGRLLSRMLLGGFTRLEGIDPFIPADIVFGEAARIFRQDLPGYIAKSPEKYDLVMLHHSFEHMHHQAQVLNWCSQLVKDDGWLLIRVPLADSEAWERYRGDWYSLDAPRHLYLHTSASMRLLIEQSGLHLVAEQRDSIGSQFLFSELYARNIAANAPRSQRDIFSKKQLKDFADRARKLNDEGRGDQGVFYIRKASPEHGIHTDRI